MTTYWAPAGWLGGDDLVDGLSIRVDDGTIAAVEHSPDPPAGGERLGGVVIPGLANAHSHAFHRVLRGRAQTPGGSFWTWRDAMYEVANRLDPDTLRHLATAVFAEMLEAGITVVGEFHYVHRRPDGGAYEDPNEMGRAVVDAARSAGIRLTLLDTCYLRGGLHADGHDPLRPEQRRFGDGSVAAYLERISSLADDETTRHGTAIHSVRAVEPGDIERIGLGVDAPLHAHVSERPEENELCLAAFGRSPTQLLGDSGVLDERLTAVHGTHLTPHDMELLGDAGAGVCLCPTTERDLADGIGPASELRATGASLSLGTDSQAVIDLLEEARAMELDERLRSNTRGHQSAGQLLEAATSGGYRALGWPEGGRIESGAPADFVVVRRDSVRTSGTGGIDGIVFSATATDVTDVFVAGRRVVADGRHREMDVARALAEAVEAVLT